MKKLILRIFAVLVILGLVALVASYFFLGSIIKKGVETVGPMITKTDVKLESASLSLFSGSGTLKGFVLGNPAGFKTESAMKVGSIKVGVLPGSVLSDKIHVTEVNLQAPEITFEGGLKGNNLSKLMENVEAASGTATSGKDSSQSAAGSRKLQVDDLVVSGGRINLSIDVALVGGKSATVPLPDIHLTGLGQGPEGITATDLTKKVLDEILKTAIPAAEKAIVDLGKGITDAVGGANKDAAGSASKAAKDIGDLFKKKQ